MGKLNKNKSIAYALWTPDNSEKKSTTPNLRDLTLSWLRFGYQGPVIESESISSILTQALDKGFKACFIQKPGNIISEDWMLPHWQTPDFHQCLLKQYERNDFLVCANLIQTDEYFALDPRCMLINLRQFETLGRPEFGLETNHSQPLMQAKGVTIASTYQLETTSTIKSITPELTGWGFIDISLRKNLNLQSLPESLASKHVNLTPSLILKDANQGKQSSTTVNQKSFLSGVAEQIKRGREGVFLWNIESYGDVPKNINSNEFDSTANNIPIRNLYCVAAGFKPNMLLHRHGFTPESKVTFFDYSQQALLIRKTLIEQWDGADYPAFCQNLMAQFSSEETFYQLWNGLQPDQIDWTDVDKLWQRELDHWGGEQAFQQHWQAQQRLDYDFIHGDFINAPEILLNEIENTNGSMIWWSNAFFTISSNWLMSIEQRRQCFSAWIDELAVRSPECRLYGADHNNTPVNRITAQVYSKQLKQRSNTIQFDELVTDQHSAHPLRF